MKRKGIAILGAAMLCMGLFTGCGESAEKESETAKATEAATEEQTEANQDAGDSVGTQQGDEAQGGTAADGEALSDTTVAGWHIVVEGMEVNKSLENVSVDLGYTGVETSDFVKEAGEGNVYCLLKMNIEKDGSKEVIDWPSLKLTDAEGNEYTRIEDEFITDLGMTRMSGTALNFGSNEGWIAFEIKEGATGLQLSYPFEAETYTCDLPDVQ